MNKKSKKHIFLFLEILVLAVCGYYLYSRFSENISSLVGVHWATINYFELILAFVVYIIFFSVKVTNWRHILKLFDVDVSYPFAAGIWYGSQTIKYVPGKVWFILGRFYLGRKKISKSIIFMGTALEITMMLLSAILAFLTLGRYQEIVKIGRFFHSPLFLIASIIVFMLIIHPRVLECGFGILAKLGKKTRQHITIPYIFRSSSF